MEVSQCHFNLGRRLFQVAGGEEQGGKHRDPALTVKSQKYRSQPKP
jgi:hypothetical protein